MEEKLKLAVIAPCIAPTRDYIRLLDESATRQNIPLMPYGIGDQFADWRTMLITQTIPELERLSKEFSHVLVVDGRDCLFVSRMNEIIYKYLLAGAPPCLMSHDEQNPLVPSLVNAGCYIGEIEYMARLWSFLAGKYPNEGDYQQWVRREWPIFGIVCDVHCQIFQSVDGIVPVTHCRVLNLFTGQMPCVLHFRGGYSDPVTGRESRILPVLKQLYGE